VKGYRDAALSELIDMGHAGRVACFIHLYGFGADVDIPFWCKDMAASLGVVIICRDVDISLNGTNG
jgi:hypothetical protein